MKTYNIHEAKTHLSRLLKDVEAGNSFRIARNGKVVAVVAPAETQRKEREPGLWKDLDWPVDFDTMNQEEIEKMFYGDDLPPLEEPPIASAAE